MLITTDLLVRCYKGTIDSRVKYPQMCKTLMIFFCIQYKDNTQSIMQDFGSQIWIHQFLVSYYAWCNLHVGGQGPKLILTVYILITNFVTSHFYIGLHYY